MKTMNIGMTGMNAHTAAMSVISDNIANVNTLGFKASRARFQDLMASTQLGVGDGVSMAGTQQQFGQGSLEATGNALDLAVAGDGFLMVRSDTPGEEGTFLTRSGGFTIDNEGFVASPDGMRLQGYGVDGNGNVSQTRLGDIQVGDASAPPNATSEAQMRLNLGAGTEISGPFDPADPSGSSNFASSTTVYDSLGNAIDADAYYVKTAENTWEVHVMIDGGDSAGGTAGTPLEIGTSTLDFDTDGALTAGSPLTLSMTPAGATSPQTIELDLTGTTQFAGESAVSFASQDGYGAGELRGLEISDDGTMMGVFSNGEQIALGQVALAKVSAPEFLDRLGGNLWRVTQQSGEALAGAPSSGGRGAMVSGAVEGSNVDITYEFVKMIATQRGFQANSRSITTADQMITEAIQLKR